MVKILIVDDELPIREWMAFCIRQSGISCEIVGQATDGEQALALFEQHCPDLVFTDIKMPGMDGIELARRIRAKSSTTKLVFLTSHGEFSYARQALVLGAEGYILKTEIKAEDIVTHIKACEVQPDQSFSAQLRMQSFVPRLLEGAFPTEMQVQQALLDIGFQMENYALAALAVRPAELFIEEPATLEQNIGRKDGYSNLCCFSYKEDMLLVAANLPKTPSTMIQTQALASFAQDIGEYFRAPVCISSIHPGLNHLRNAFEECILHFNLLFYSSAPQQVLYCGALQPAQFRDVTKLTEDLLARVGEVPPAALLEELLAGLRQAASPDIPLVKECVTRFLHRVATGKIKNTAIFLEVAQKIDTVATTAPTFACLAADAGALMARLEAGWSPQQEKKHSMNVQLALQYLQKQYAAQPSLSEAAEYVGVSAEHLSRVFKQEVGTTFVAYLTTYRMDKAMELLRTTNLKIYEVAERTGYANLSYFSKSFKKQFGCTPFQVRAPGEGLTTI